MLLASETALIEPADSALNPASKNPAPRSFRKRL